MRQPLPNSKGFTLIELLIVIAIICILVAILFPIFESARDSARMSACISNVKQMGEAMQLYCSDYDEVFPEQDSCYGLKLSFPPIGTSSTTGFTDPGAGVTPPGLPSTAYGCVGSPGYGDRINHYKWWYWLWPYVKTSNIFFCPSRPLSSSDLTNYQNWMVNGEIANGYALNLSVTGALYDIKAPKTYGLCAFSYGCRNSFLVTTPADEVSNGSLLKSTPVSAITQPSELLLIMEKAGYVLPTYGVTGSSCGNYSNCSETVFPPADKGYWNMVFKDVFSSNAYVETNPVNYSSNAVDKNAAPHRDGIVIAYADGHAKWLSVDEFLANCPNVEDYMPNVAAGSSMSATGAADAPSAPHLTRDWPMWGLYQNQWQ